jgi:hypothetical protein
MSEERLPVQVLGPNDPVPQLIDPWENLPQQASKTALERITAVKKFCDTNLLPQLHYGTVRGVTKPFLWKTGAEYINCAWMIRPRYSTVDQIRDLGQQIFHYRVKCELVTPSGHVVGEAEGTADSYDKNLAFTRVEGRPPGNSVYQRAQKRAYIAATKTLWALSEKFYIEGEGVPGDEGQPDTTGEKAPESDRPKKSAPKAPASSGEPRQDGLL